MGMCVLIFALRTVFWMHSGGAGHLGSGGFVCFGLLIRGFLCLWLGVALGLGVSGGWVVLLPYRIVPAIMVYMKEIKFIRAIFTRGCSLLNESHN